MGITSAFAKEIFMRVAFTFAVAAAFGLTVAAAAQQPPPGERLAGKIKSVSPGDVVLTTASGDVDLGLTPKTRVVVREAAGADQIKAGAYLGTSNQNSADGSSGVSTEVHLMENGPNVHYPMNDSGLMMTNGHVKSVKTTPKGQEIDVDYGQAEARHIIVPAGATTRLVDVGVAALKPGLDVSAMVDPAGGGRASAVFISISPPATK
jgi:hypothetical protein